MWVKQENENHYFINVGHLLPLVSLMAFMSVVLWKLYDICTLSLQDLTLLFLRTKLVVADNAIKYISNVSIFHLVFM